MSSSDIAISVRGLSKSYTIAHQQEKHSTLAESVLARLCRPFHRAERETFWALKDVSFDIEQGDVVGIIGRNGAGKSTLLKVLSRITEPTKGEIDLYGRVGSLLEVGTGFHPELTGRENIFLNGAILGMNRGEIRRQFDAIVDFAGVEKFLDTPVKRYSSGMYVRLAFAVAAHLQSEILIVDEVLAVGDAEFQRKCLGKMKEVATGGRTVLFVSHQMHSISLLCNKAVYLSNGEMGYSGKVTDAIGHYKTKLSGSGNNQMEPRRRSGNGDYRFTSVMTSSACYEPSEDKIIKFTICKHNPSATGKFAVRLNIADANGVTILQCDSRVVGHWIRRPEGHRGALTIRTPWLKPGAYTIDAFVVGEPGVGFIDKFERAAEFEVSELLPYSHFAISAATAEGLVFADFSYSVLPAVSEDVLWPVDFDAHRGGSSGEWPAARSHAE